MNLLQHTLSVYLNTSLIFRIIIAIIAAIILASALPHLALKVEVLGSLFVGALKAIAPVLVFLLIISSISQQSTHTSANLRPILILYLIGTLCAAAIAASISLFMPSQLTLATAQDALSAPQNITEVLSSLLIKITQNPLAAVAEANYLGVLVWGACFGFVLKKASETTKNTLKELSDAITTVVKGIIQLAPLGIFGLVAYTVADTGFNEFLYFAHIIMVLVLCMLIMMFIVNPLLVLIKTRSNPYPLLFKCLKDSAITAFFTRSSAANIPVNMQLCKELKLNKDTYSVSIPLGATINMEGAAITITVMTLAAVHTLGISVDLSTAILLSVLASVAACGASGVAGGSLLLIPLACSLFGIDNDTAMKVVAIGFIIGVIQDSLETALNSSTDALFTAAVCQSQMKN